LFKLGIEVQDRPDDDAHNSQSNELRLKQYLLKLPPIDPVNVTEIPNIDLKFDLGQIWSDMRENLRDAAVRTITLVANGNLHAKRVKIRIVREVYAAIDVFYMSILNIDSLIKS
jgi:hypothetical protein